MSLDDHIQQSDFFADPYLAYDTIREQDPVHWSEIWQAWIITRYDDVMRILRDSQRFSNEGRQQSLLNQFTAEQQAELMALEQHYAAGGLINSDPPKHTRLRALVSKAFTPRMVQEMTPRIQRLIDELIDSVVNTGQMDVIGDLAYPLPATVIAEMLGAPAQDQDQFKQWSEDTNAFLGTGKASFDHALQAQKSLYDMKDYLRTLLHQRQKDPQEDLLTELASAEEQGTSFTEAEILSTCHTLLVAGHETTTNLIGNGLLAVLAHPAEWHKLQSTPQLIQNAIEEMLRYDGPAHSVKRVASEDVSMSGKTIRKGQLVYLMLGAANRDPSQFRSPDQFMADRSPDELKTVAFGYGAHFCVGAPLARLEGKIAFDTMFRRLPNLKLESEKRVQWKHNMSIRGLESLSVIF